MAGFDAQRFRDVSHEALLTASNYIRDAIQGNFSEGSLTIQDPSYLFVKGDKTVVTLVDKESQRRAIEVIQKGLPEYGIRAEEGKGMFGIANSPIRIMLDPLDGTGGFLIGGPTPTVIMAAYDRKAKKVLACSTMEPSTGRFWYSAEGEGAHLSLRNDYTMDDSDAEFINRGKLSVNGHSMKGSSVAHVLVDVTHPFVRTMPDGSKKPMLSRCGRRVLTDMIEKEGAKESSFYTNGGHYALVAMGRPGLFGCITTAVGGPFDIAGIRHVLEAGGAAQCYAIEGTGRRTIRSIEQDIESADIAIAANSAETLATLENAVREAVGN